MLYYCLWLPHNYKDLSYLRMHVFNVCHLKNKTIKNKTILIRTYFQLNNSLNLKDSFRNFQFRENFENEILAVKNTLIKMFF